MLTKSCLSADEAQKMVAACKAEAEKNQWRVSIAVVDEAGLLMHLERMDGAVPQSPDVAIRKARTSALTRTSTKILEDVAKERPATLTFPDRLPVQGGVPLMYQGACVGAIGVSGAKSPEDEVVALAGAAVLD
jgi:glc operon protein GlcG